MAPPSEPLILYLYTFSPYGRKVLDYLAFRQIPHIQVHQGFVPPRPDILALGVNYRRIPVLSIGRDIYVDTLLILAKLEQLYPASSKHPAIGAASGPDKALQDLLEKWTTEVVFLKALWTMPSDFPAFQDAAFTKDRGGIWGGEWGKERQEKLRGPGLQHMAGFFAELENLVGDGRKFVLGTDKPTLADINAIWPFHWLLELVPGSIPDDFEKQFPKAFAWRNRYFEAVKASTSALGEQKVIEGAEATKQVSSAGFGEAEGKVDSSDPIAQALGLKQGSKVEVYPEDISGGDKHKDVGELVALTPQEVVIKTKTQDGSAEVRIHAPRFNYKLQSAS